MMLDYIKAEGLKNRHTVSAKLFWMVPFVSILISSLLGGQEAKYYQTNQYNWWYTTFFPMLMLLSTAFTVQRERKLKNRAMGALPADMKKLWAAKVLHSFKTLFLAAVIVYAAQEVISRVFSSGAARGISSLSGLEAMGLCLVLIAWQIPVWLFVNQTIGFAAGIIIGLAANLGVGILGALSRWWVFNPFTYICRLMCPVLKILPNNLPAEPGSMTFYPGVLGASVIPVGMGCSLALFVICYMLTANWYKRKGVREWEN